MQTILAFVVALGLLILIHELGHYLVARACGVKVLKFSIGFGRPILARRFGRDDTLWAISVLPLGGYVAMLDERESTEPIPAADLPRAFNRQSPLRRIAIVAAGPVANLLLAAVLYAALDMHGVREPRAILGTPPAASLAADAGLRDGDVLDAVDGQPITSWVDARWQLLKSGVDRKPVRLDVTGIDGQRRELVLPLDRLPEADPDGKLVESLGMAPRRPRARILRIDAGSAAERAGLREGDVVEAIDGVDIADAGPLVERIRASADREVTLSVRRDVGSVAESRLELAVTPVAAAGADGASIGRIGVAFDVQLESVEVRRGLFSALGHGAERTWDMSLFSLRMMGKMVIGEVSLRNLSGPVTIADFAGQTARIGLEAYVAFLALISVSLGVLNLLPIPVLDGGHILYYSVEFLRGSPLPQRVIEVGQRAGLGLLAAMMAIALFNDLTRLFG
ncbi:RIP metalloprotease RseP [Derxia gummosa]|uniref:Zinc metalloprotease n=1 Tax=Derxia gummosa DSM 723 TaxID=1121388 RepID=A0A8B6X3A9_9BURK|nr:RIP metalloprotease RseP [Derxia gummosa]